ncbi:CD276 antigen-like [Bufo gargarizans]|uniref:CD276 antigen-like n=1 Tax=Bufo gargarizans TaxID=30331 RepID=UPI001CF48B66|nr:CD276 antigen-like [Bufo gargarizans]
MEVSLYSNIILIISMIGFAEESGGVPIWSSKQQVTAGEGGTAVLSCHFSPEKLMDNLTVVWVKRTAGAEDAVVHAQGTQKTFHNQSAAYSNRTAMDKDWFQRNDTTLNVHRIRAMDAGEYSCWIIQPPPSLLTAYKCCTVRLSVEWRDDLKQLIVVWSLYFLSIALCIFFLDRCRRQKAPPDGIHEP